MSIAIVCSNKDPEPWRKALLAQDPSLDLHVWPQETAPESVDFALCWRQPDGALQRYPNLKCVCSMGAGVDNILEDAAFPRHLPLLRIVDPKLSQSMFEYVAACALDHLRQSPIYRKQQEARTWQPQAPLRAEDICIGLMGLGVIGLAVAEKLAGLGFQVAGWSQSRKRLDPKIQGFYGRAQREAFVSRCDILVCLLPLTKATRGILNADTLAALPRGACIINVARGEHLREEDLLQALQNGRVSAAYLDVFQQEPLAPEHPFWQQPGLYLTPHIASITDPGAVAAQIVENYRRLQQNKPLLNRVDIARGY